MLNPEVGARACLAPLNEQAAHAVAFLDLVEETATRDAARMRRRA